MSYSNSYFDRGGAVSPRTEVILLQKLNRTLMVFDIANTADSLV
jgi:hypothetical protein